MNATSVGTARCAVLACSRRDELRESLDSRRRNRTRITRPSGSGFRVWLIAAWLLVAASWPAGAQPLLSVVFGNSVPSQFAAATISTNDFWNSATLPQNKGGSAVLPLLKWADATDSPVSLVVSNLTEPADNTVIANAGDTIVINTQLANPRRLLTVSQLPTGLYRFFIYGHPIGPGGRTSVSITSGEINFGSKPPSANSSRTNAEVVFGAELAMFSNLEIGANQSVNILLHSISESDSQFALDAVQIEMTGASSNGNPNYYSSIFTSIERFPNGNVRMRLVGPRGAVVGVESSTNLLEWLRLTTITNTGENVNFSETNSTKPLNRFFRVVPP